MVEKDVLHGNGPKKQVGVIILISDKIVFMTKLIRRDREGYHILNTGKIHQDDITIFTFLHQTQPKFIKEVLLQRASHIVSYNVSVIPHYPTLSNRQAIEIN